MLKFDVGAGMWGAGFLCAEASARSGAGYTYLLRQPRLPMSRHFDFLTVESRKLNFIQFQAIAIGSGFRHPLKIKKYIQTLLKVQHPYVVLDAEALKIVTKMKKTLPETWILTPHEGELGKMLKKSSQTVRKNRLAAIKEAHKKWGCIVILKGHHSLVAGPQHIFQIPSGNSALAKAGTGDVLTGMIAGFISQGLKPFDAACLATYLHGAIADRWTHEKKDVLSLMATDLLALLPTEIRRLRS